MVREVLIFLFYHNFLFVNGLKSNILNINQFCDENYSVQFSKNKCNIQNCVGLLMKGVGTLDNCNGISTLTTLGCHKVTLDSTDLWHQCLGHINFRDLSKIFKMKSYLSAKSINRQEDGV